MGNKKRMANVDVSEEEFITAIRDTGGIIRDILRRLKISPWKLYELRDKYPASQEAFNAARRMGALQVHETIYQQALAGDAKAQSLYLKYNPASRDEGWRAEETITLKTEKPLTDIEKKRLLGDVFGKEE